MTPKQREAAERLIDDRLTATMEWSRQVVALLRELLAADVAENATTEQVQAPNVTISGSR